MSLPYRMNDGAVIFLAGEGITQERAHAIYDDLRAHEAARDPGDVAYGRTMRDRRLNLPWPLAGMSDCATRAGFPRASEWSAIEHGKRGATDDERRRIEAALSPQSGGPG